MRTKFDMRAKQGVLIGYALQTRGYRIWIPTEHKIIESVNVRIAETEKNEPPQTSDQIDLEMLFPENEMTIVHTRIPVDQKLSPKTLKSEPDDKEILESESESEKTPQTESENEETPESESENEYTPEIFYPEINWTRTCKLRSNGSRIDVYYYPEGSNKRLRTLKEIKAYCLLENIKFNENLFDFSSKNPFQGVISSSETASSLHSE
jgi:hypothetical protein